MIERIQSLLAKFAALDLRANTVQCEIDGLVYTSTKWPARVGLEIAPRVAALVGAGVMRLVMSGARGDDIDLDQVMGAIVQLSDRAIRDGLVPLVLSTLANTQCNRLRGEMTGDGQPKAGPVADSFDSHFAGEYGHLLAVCLFVLVHNLRGPTLGAR